MMYFIKHTLNYKETKNYYSHNKKISLYYDDIIYKESPLIKIISCA